MAMELEYIFKIGIMLVVVAVVIGLIFTFKDQISNSIKNVLCQMTNTCSGGIMKLTVKECCCSTCDKQSPFSSSEIATYIQSCYSSITSVSPADIPPGVTDCYVLKGNFNADSSSVIQLITNPDLKTKVLITSDFTSAVVISYKDPDGTILVK